MSSVGVFAFGPFQLNVRSKCLFRAGKPVALPLRQFDLLHALVTRAGEVVLKDDLIKIVWQDHIVTDNMLSKQMTELRRLLDPKLPDRYIETVTRRGYRFVAPVERVDERLTRADLDAMIAPFRAFTDGRALIETLELGAVARARSMFQQLLVRHNHEAEVHVGLANACLLMFEATRADLAPDAESLRIASEHAAEACRLQPGYAEAWATHGFVLARMGKGDEALGPLQMAMSLDPDNWLHPVRLALSTWGGARLRAARRALDLMPGCPLAHWLIATVFVARGMLAEAERHVDAGLASVLDQPSKSFAFSLTGLYWLKGLLCLARGDEPGALDSFARELALEPAGHLYARECCANTWYAIGAIHLRRGDKEAARAAFAEATMRVKGHVMAEVGLAMVTAEGDHEMPPVPGGISMAAVMALAVSRAMGGDAAGAAQIVDAALVVAPPGNAGWIVGIEPLLKVHADRAAWTTVLARVRERAV